MSNLEFQVEKKTRVETNLKSFVLEGYHYLLDMFSKENSDILARHRKYDHKIVLKEE